LSFNAISSLSCGEHSSCVLEGGEIQSGLAARTAALGLVVAGYWLAVSALARSWRCRI